jgi:polysaccharide transporter, PST family
MSLDSWLIRLGMTTQSRRKIFENVFWLLMDKCFAIIDAFFIGALVARHLGPSDLGLWSYSLALAGILSTIANLGLDNLIVSKFVRDPETRGPLLWNATCMKLATSIILLFAALAFVGNQEFSSESGVARSVFLVSLIPLLFSPIANFRLLLEAEVASKWNVWVNNSCLLLSAITRVVLVALAAPVLPFAIAAAFFTILSSVSLAIVVTRLRLLPAMTMPSRSMAKEILVESWPLLLTSLSVFLYMNVDIIMLKWLMSDEAAGVYSIATRLSSIWYFIPLVLSSTLLPSLTALYSASPTEYLKRLQWYFDVNAVTSLVCVGIALLFFPTIIRKLFGPEYDESVRVFIYHIWAIPFVFLGVARGQHLIIAGHHRFNLFSTQFGLVVNIALNFILIPWYGPQGAAISTIVSFASSAYLSSFFVKAIRNIGYIQTKALITSPWRLLREPFA